MVRNIITVSGPPASGTSTLSENLSRNLNGKIVSGGDIFQELAEEKDMTPQEFSNLAETDPKYDKQIDSRLKTVIEEHYNADSERHDFDTLIVDSRLAGWHASEMADMKIYLTAELSVRSSRINDRDENIQQVQNREQSEQKRYADYYGIDVTDLSIYDLVVDTGTFSQKAVEELALTAVNNSQDINTL